MRHFRVLLHHLDSCIHVDKWVPTHQSHNKDGTLIAQEFRCTLHHENFWLSIPNRKADYEGVNK